MKKLILIVVILGSFVMTKAQVELKGLELGSKYNNERTETSVGGYEGVIHTFNLNDGRTYKIEFKHQWYPLVGSFNTDRFIKGLENKYDIKLTKNEVVSTNKYNFFYRTNKNGVDFIVSSQPGLSSSYVEIRIEIENIALRKLKKKEEQDKVNRDF